MEKLVKDLTEVPSGVTLAMRCRKCPTVSSSAFCSLLKRDVFTLAQLMTEFNVALQNSCGAK